MSDRVRQSARPGAADEARGVAGATPPAPRRIALVSTGAPFDRAVIERVVELAAGTKPKVFILSIAKIWGTSLGFPHPGLQPSKREVDGQKAIVEDAATKLRRRGLDVKTRVIATRKPAKTIAGWAQMASCQAIVMADPVVARWRRIVEGSPAGDLARRTRIPVYAVPTPAETRRRRKVG